MTSADYKDRDTRLCNDKQMDLHPPLHDYYMNLDCIRYNFIAKNPLER
jgi:hypothetical protein